jgi:N-acetylneuraminate synthase
VKVRLTEKTEVSNFGSPYIIAEIGSNHNGDMGLAARLIEKARDAGAHCVKFQSWSKESIFSRKVYEENHFLADDYRDRTDFTLEQIVEKFSISEEQLLEMKGIASKLGIDCISTPFSRHEVDFLVEGLNAPFIKVASMDLNNYPFLEYIAGKGLPVVLSTGLSTLGEIDEAVRTIERAGNTRIIVLHCVSIYPPADDQVNLFNMETLRTAFPYPVGFSDHTIGTSIPLAAIALGACIIEKHFTLDKRMFGWDHKVSADFDEMRTIAQEAERIHLALGSRRINVVEPPERIRAFRRSIVAARDIAEGEVIEPGMLDFKRPADGLPPGDLRRILGRKAKRAIKQDDILTADDV